ncbi:MAG: CbbQ/NirQ/NorQ/GpvN family protein [Deltaproteobacteria bacterium]|nr:CbbQ/NirQ/NorQ/GpvN family protein [Deltaproteobacteria bacterium]
MGKALNVEEGGATEFATPSKIAENIQKGAASAAPFYLPVGSEVEVFQAAFARRLPILLKGPTGCGKTRFVSHMAATLNLPLHTVSCHDDLTGSDLVGRYLIKGSETVWTDGPLTRAVRDGGICYLDEVVEARKDTTVVLHPLADDRRILTIEKTGEEIVAHKDFLLVVSYNPGYQHVLKDLKTSTRQRFISLEFDYPEAKTEIEVVIKESGIDKATAERLVALGQKMRETTEATLETPPGTRLLVHAGMLIKDGLSPALAIETAIISTLTDDQEVKEALMDMVAAYF